MKKNQSNIKAMMNQRSFRLNMLLFQQHAPFHIKVEERFKQNLGTVPAFILISSDPKYACPIVYWQPFFNSMSDIELAGFLTQYYKYNSQHVEKMMSTYLNQNHILSRVLPRILAKKDANDLKKNGVHFSYLENLPDFIASYYIEKGDDSISLITDDDLNHEGITAEELHEAAKRNILDAVVIRPMFLLKTSKEVKNKKTGMNSDFDSIWIATLSDEYLGAGILAGGQKMFLFLSTALGSQKYFFLPTSIHQVLLIPDNGCTNYIVQMFKQLDGGIPLSVIPLEERLGGKIYHYDSVTGHITQCN